MSSFNKTNRTEFCRTFLIAGLPETMTAADPHLQIFDNYVEGTRLRLRLIRIPEKNTWTRILQQHIPADERGARIISEIGLNEDEYLVFKQFRGREIRKNRYSYESGSGELALDVYLGNLRGLVTMIASFENAAAMRDFDPPAFALSEVTGESFFKGEVLVEKSFGDVQEEFNKTLTRSAPK